jgi:SAM-dependent methyltransferase
MSDWSAGYVTDIEYLPGFYREQAPALLDLVCLLNRVEPPDRLDRVRYCELGCGQGITALLLAAANPEIEFWGVDFHPAHIARGRALAAEAQLDNVHLIEQAFADLTGPGAPELPQFDYITMHGVYSWISEENRRAIVRFVAQHLKPGGVVYVSYNCMPGWIIGLPLQRLLSDYANSVEGGSDRAIEGAIAFARRMQEAGARPLADPEIVERLEKELARGQGAYLAHEYLNENWTPMYHADVTRELAAAKLAYVGSATLLENFPDLSLAPQQRRLLGEVATPSFRETLKDYFMARSFRRDVFVRGARRMSEAAQAATLRDLRLSLAVPPTRLRHEIEVPVGEAKLEERLYAPVFAELKRRPASVGELLELPGVKGVTTATPVELTGMLVGSWQAAPLLRAVENESARRGVHAFNAAMTRRAVAQGKTSAPVAAAATGSGLHLTLFEMLAYERLAAGTPADDEALARAAWQALSARGETLRTGGEPIVGEAENHAILRREIAAVLADALPVWRQLGVL